MNIRFESNNLNDLAILIQMPKRLNIKIEEVDNAKDELQTNQLTKLSFESLEQIWNSKEDEVWDKFFKETQRTIR